MNRIDGDPEEPRSGSDRSTFRSYEILDGVFLFGGGNIEQLVGEVTGEDREILLRYDTFRDVPPPIPPEIEEKIPPEYRESRWHMAYYAEEIEDWNPDVIVEKIHDGTPLSRFDKYNHKLGPNLGFILRKIQDVENGVKEHFLKHIRSHFSAKLKDKHGKDSDLRILL